MQYRLKMLPEQARTLGRWTHVADDAAPLLIDWPADWQGGEAVPLTVGQGDERVTIEPDGTHDGEIGIEPLTVPEALTLNNTDQDPLILAAEAILAELAGRIDEDDADGELFHAACDAWDAWRQTATRLAKAAGKTPDEPLTVGERIARMGRELIDPDYDPAAEDEPEPFGGGDGSEPGPAGGEDEPRVTPSMMAADHLYGDPLAADEDGEPLYSDETRAAAAGDPRGERDR